MKSILPLAVCVFPGPASYLQGQALQVNRLQHHHFAYSVEHLKYPTLDTARDGPKSFLPGWERATHPIAGTEVNPGGSPKGNAESSLDAITKVLGFPRTNLSRE
jgi:hypothetical protein